MRAFVIAGALALSAGCVTEERKLPPTAASEALVRVDDSPPPLVEQEQKLKDLIDDADGPQQKAQAWWRLGDFYEDGMRYREALGAYANMHRAILELPGGDRYTAGPYHQGVMLTRLKEFPAAVVMFQEVLKLQPKDVQQAALYDHFRESHYLLGWIYYQTKQWDPAQSHLTTFKEMGGAPERVDSLLMNISYEKKSK